MRIISTICLLTGELRKRYLQKFVLFSLSHYSVLVTKDKLYNTTIDCKPRHQRRLLKDLSMTLEYVVYDILKGKILFRFINSCFFLTPYCNMNVNIKMEDFSNVSLRRRKRILSCKLRYPQ